MKIKFLGTGAADWNIKDRRDGEFFRRLSSTLINDDLLIDPGPHIFDFCERENCPTLFENVTDIIVTHSHADHFCADTVKRLFNEKARRIWCNETVAEKLCGIAECNAVLAGDCFCAGKYSVTALKANHTPVMAGENTLLYNISDGKKSIFYGLDSAWLPYETWSALLKAPVDCMILDVTLGDAEGDYRIFEHNNIPMVDIMLQTARSQKALKEGGKAVGTHFSKYEHKCHEKLSERLEQLGMLAAYDGMEIEI